MTKSLTPFSIIEKNSPINQQTCFVILFQNILQDKAPAGFPKKSISRPLSSPENNRANSPDANLNPLDYGKNYLVITKISPKRIECMDISYSNCDINSV